MMVWLDGRLVTPAKARIDPTDRGFTLGDGVFETILAQAGAPVHLELHLARLREGASVLGIGLGWSDAAILDAVAAVLAGSGLRDAAVRLTLTRGPAARGVLPAGMSDPTLLIAAAALPPPAGPARAVIATVTRRNEASPLSRIKSLNYLDSILARREAAARGADEAILLNTQGRVAEASASNLFVIRGGVVTTPPVADGALPGIARGRLLAAGLAVERSLAADELLAADACFVSSSLGLRAISAIDGRILDVADPALRRVLDQGMRHLPAGAGRRKSPA